MPSGVVKSTTLDGGSDGASTGGGFGAAGAGACASEIADIANAGTVAHAVHAANLPRRNLSITTLPFCSSSPKEMLVTPPLVAAQNRSASYKPWRKTVACINITTMEI
jgi:hypothetical protein